MKLKTLKLSVLILSALLILSCGVKAPGEKNTEILSAAEALRSAADPGTILIDARSGADYRSSHIEGAYNVSRADIVVNSPFIAMLAPASQIEDVMGRRGIDNTMNLIIYDDSSNMDSARLWWTLKYYGNDNVKVVSGGLQALLRAGAALTDSPPQVQQKKYTATEERKKMLAVRDDLRALVDLPEENAVIIDTRSKEEYEDEGTIPGSILIDYRENNFRDGTFRPVQQIRIRYLEDKIDYNREIYIFCKTSIRAAQTYLALYNAGYRNMKIYDAAFVEWQANPMNPVYKPERPAHMIQSSDIS